MSDQDAFRAQLSHSVTPGVGQVWDKILKLNLIPQKVFDTEIAFYSKNFGAARNRLPTLGTFALGPQTILSSVFSSLIKPAG